MNENQTQTVTETADLHAHHGPFHQQAEFWVGVSFILVVVALSKPIAKAIKTLVSKRIESIIGRIHDADKLKEDAQKLLAEYEKKLQNSKKEAQEILNHSKQEIEFIKKDALKMLEREIKIKEKEAETRINSAKEKASKEVVNLASSLSIKAVKLALSNNLDTKAQDSLIDSSIESIGKI